MLFLLFLCILANEAAAQGSAVTPGPETTITAFSTPVAASPSDVTLTAATTIAIPPTANTATVQDCNSCFLVAQVDQVVLGTRASYYTRLGNFKYGPSDLTGSLSLAALPTASVITYNRLLVNNPTIYDVFTAFQSYTQSFVGGSCRTILGSISTLSTPLSIQLPTDAPSSAIFQAEEFFIGQIGDTACIAGGVVVSTVAALTFTLPEQSLATPTGSNRSSSNITHTVPTNNSTGITSTISSNDSGLSQSARLGIGIGIGAPGAAVLVLIGVLLWKRNNRKKHTKGRTDPTSELPLGGPRSLAELENKIPPQELENNVAPQELSVE